MIDLTIKEKTIYKTENLIRLLTNKNFEYSSDLISYMLDAGYPLDFCYEMNDMLFNGVIKFKENEEEITKYITSYEHACKILNLKTLTLDDYSNLPIDEQKQAFALHKLKRIIKVLNQGWEPNFDNSNEYKYFPYFDMRNLSFSYHYCNNWYYNSLVGAGLLFKELKSLEYAVKIFLNEYKDFHKY